MYQLGAVSMIPVMESQYSSTHHSTSPSGRNSEMLPLETWPYASLNLVLPVCLEYIPGY